MVRQKSYDHSPSLYLIPTPVGNMEDITLRTIEVLKMVDFLLCEDTRVTSELLHRLNIKKKLIHSDDHNENSLKEMVLENLKNGLNIGLVTDRGTPIISDPGYKIVEYISKVHDRLPEIRCIARNRHNRTNRLISLPEKDQTGQKNGGTHADGNRIDTRPYQVGIANCCIPCSTAILGKIFENLRILILSCKDLRNAGSDNILLQIGIQV